MQKYRLLKTRVRCKDRQDRGSGFAVFLTRAIENTIFR